LDLHGNPRTPDAARHRGLLVWRILLAALALALARTTLMVLKDEHLAAGLLGLGARAASRQVLAGFAICLLPVAVVAVASARLAGRRPLARGAILAAAVAGGYLFVSFRLPALRYYAPELDGSRAYAAHGAALLSAVIAAALLLPGLRLPGMRAAALAGVVLVLVPAAVLQLRRASGVRAAAGPNSILISLDTLRADRLGCYGYSAGTTPEIDAFAREATVFTSAYSPEAFTLTAHMSMLTSLYPSAHGVGSEQPLAPGVPTLAERFGREGYATLAVVDDAYWISPRFGFDRGFELYHVMPRVAELEVDWILALLDDLDREPFFLFAHFYDAHSDRQQLPYESDPADQEAFAGWYDGDFDGCDEQLCASELLLAMGQRGEVLAGADREYLSSLYDAGVRTLDRQLGRLFRGLEQRGLFERSAILVTSDHGEEFFEHGRALHGQNFAECLRVPFILRPPGGQAGRCDAVASLVDVAPTLLDYCGSTPEITQGVSLAPLLAGGQLERPREHVLIDGRAGQLGLHTRRWALVPTAGRVVAFDLEREPGQLVGLAPEAEPDELLLLRALLEREAEGLHQVRERFGTSAPLDPSASEAQALRELGYLGDP
jgi:arylsulfatase A-like enzyme